MFTQQISHSIINGRGTLFAYMDSNRELASSGITVFHVKNDGEVTDHLFFPLIKLEHNIYINTDEEVVANYLLEGRIKPCVFSLVSNRDRFRSPLCKAMFEFKHDYYTNKWVVKYIREFYLSAPDTPLYK